MPFETEPLHIEAARALRRLADYVEQTGQARAFVAAVIVEDKPDCVEFGGEMGAIESVLDQVRDGMANAIRIGNDTDFDALDAVVV